MNITEGNAVNKIVRRLMELDSAPAPELVDAASYLAGRSHTVLHAGLTPGDVAARWSA